LQLVVRKAAQLFQLRLANVTLAVVGARGQGKTHDRISRRIEPQQHRLLRLERELQDVELVAYVQVGLVHVRAPGELEDYVGLARARDRMDLAQILDDADRFFDRLRNEVLHLERCRTFIFGADGQCRIAQVGQQVDLESGKRDQAEQYECQRDHADGDASARGGFYDVHPAAPAAGSFATTLAESGLSICTAVPSRTALRPTVMTWVP